MGHFAEEQLSQLVKAAQAGDEQALHDLISWAMDYLFPAVMSMLHRLLQEGNYVSETLHTGGTDLLERLRDDAWAITHSACCRMTLRIDTFRGRNALGRPVQFATWLYAIARNEMRTLLRSRRRERKRYGASRDNLDHTCGPAELQATADEQTTSPEGTVIDRLDSELVRQALREAPLTPEQREAVVLFHGYGYRQDQIALMTGVQVGTVKKRIFDGLRKLRSYVAKRSTG